MQKRGQLTVYIIVGMVILVAFFLILFITSQESAKTERQLERLAGVQLDTVTTFVTQCLEQQIEESLDLLSQQGGYIFLPENRAFVTSLFSDLPLWIDNNRLLVPDEESMKKDINRFVIANLPLCVARLEQPGIEVFVGEPTAKTFLTTTSVQTEVSMAVKYKLEGVEKQAEHFRAEVNVPLLRYVAMAEEVANMLFETPGLIPISEFHDLPMHVNIYDIDSERKIITLEDPNVIFRNDLYQFAFALALPSEDVNLEPFVDVPAELEGRKGEVVDLSIYVVDDGAVSFGLVSQAGYIDTAGRLTITAEPGLYTASLVAEDAEGQTGVDTFQVRVI